MPPESRSCRAQSRSRRTAEAACMRSHGRRQACAQSCADPMIQRCLYSILHDMLFVWVTRTMFVMRNKPFALKSRSAFLTVTLPAGAPRWLAVTSLVLTFISCKTDEVRTLHTSMLVHIFWRTTNVRRRCICSQQCPGFSVCLDSMRILMAHAKSCC